MAKKEKAPISPASEATKIERTGNKTFNVHHSDGSIFECNVQHEKQLNNLGSKIKGQGSRITSVGGIGEKKPLICNNCKQRVSKITNRCDGRGDLCPHCA